MKPDDSLTYSNYIVGGRTVYRMRVGIYLAIITPYIVDIVN
jgi:hypothetical protein